MLTIYNKEKSFSEYSGKILLDVALEIERMVDQLRKEVSADNAGRIKAKLDATNKAGTEIDQHLAGGTSAGGGGGSKAGDQAEKERV